MKSGMGISKRTFIFFSAVFILSLLPSIASAGIPQDVNQEVKVTYQLTDVKVQDNNGRHVAGLKAKDFTLLIDGREVNIKSVDEVLSQPLKSEIIQEYVKKLEATPQGVKPPDLPVAPRFIIFVFDRGYMGEISFKQCKDLAKRMIRETLLPFDRVAVFALNNGVKVLSGPTTDKARLIAAIDGYQQSRKHDLYYPHQFEINPLRHIAPNIDPNDNQKKPMPVNINASTLKSRSSEKEVQGRNYMATFQALSKVFRNMPEKKTVLFFSDGFSAKQDSGQKIPFNYLAALEQFNSGNTTFFTIRRGPLEPEWAAGLLSEAKTNIFSFVQGVKAKREATMREIAQNTNGKFIDPGTDDDKLVELVERELGNYYLLGFIPPRTSDRKHGIKVQVKGHPEYNVILRESFTSRKRFNQLDESERRVHLEEGFLTPGFHRELDLKVLNDFFSKDGEPYIALALSLPADKVSNDAGYELELVINVEDAKGQLRRRIHKTFSSSDISGQKLQYVEELNVIKEPFAVFLAVRDNNSGKRSTWSRVVYPKPEHMKTQKAQTPFDNTFVDISNWKSRNIDDGVKVIN